MEFLSDYGLFLAKTLTLVLAVGLLLVIIASVSAKKRSPKGELSVTDLGERLRQQSRRLKAELLDKKGLKALSKKEKKAAKEEDGSKPALFVLDFKGSMDAHEVDALREEISAVVAVASKDDEVLVRLESPGGVVHGYGLAASQLVRVKDAGIPLTVAVDKVAASGGYMMACVADTIVSAPFAILGSIGVVAGVPNFHKFIKKHDIDYEQHTAGKFKRTLTVLGENTEEGREKFVADLNTIHGHFRDHVGQFRSQLNMDEVATGEIWLGVDAAKRGLCDQLATSDAYITAKLDSHRIIAVRYQLKRKLGEKVGMAARSLLTRLGI